MTGGQAAQALLPAAQRFDAAASIADGALSVHLDDPDARTPEVVAALVAAGARILEVRPEMPALEDVYLQLLRPSVGAELARPVAAPVRPS